MIYIDSFFEGYKWPQGVITGESSALLRVMQAGMRAGQEYRLAHPDATVSTYASFGFTAISAEGVWTTGFESSRFVPSEGYEGEAWWLETLPELSRQLPRDFVPKEGLRVRISGYLSKAGEHGHLGAYQRRVYVETLSVVAEPGKER